MNEAVSLVLSVIAITVSATSVIIVYQQTHVFRQTNMLPVLIDLFREFRDPEFKAHQVYVYSKLRQECDPNETGSTKLPETARSHVLPVSFFFDNLGILVASGVVDKDIVLSFAGGPIDLTWSVLEPYIQREREFRKGPYQEFFEHLVVQAREKPQSTILRKMKLRKLK